MSNTPKEMTAEFTVRDTHHVQGLPAFVKGKRLMVDTKTLPQPAAAASEHGKTDTVVLHPDIEAWARKAGGKFKRSKEDADIFVFEMG